MSNLIAEDFPPYRFITIEGLDGVGKSTAVQMLAKRIGGLAMQTPDPAFSVERREIEARGQTSDKLSFYMSSMVRQRTKFEAGLQKNHVVCDRYIHSTLAYQWPQSVNLPNNPREMFPDLLWPDLSFLLISDESTRHCRLSHREFIEGRVNQADHNKLILTVAEQRFMAMSDLIRVDTTNLSQSLVCDLLINHLVQKI